MLSKPGPSIALKTLIKAYNGVLKYETILDFHLPVTLVLRVQLNDLLKFEEHLFAISWHAMSFVAIAVSIFLGLEFLGSLLIDSQVF